MAPALSGPRKKSFYKLLWPYVGEIFLAIATAYLTTQMLAWAGDIPAGSVGVANQVINMFYLVFQIISNGAGIVMAQSIGAKTPGLKQKIATVSIFFAAILGLIGAIVIIFLGKPLLIAMNLEPIIVELGSEYMFYVGIFFFTQSISFAVSQMVYSFSETKTGLIGTIFSEIANLGLNAILIFGVPALGIPALGVVGAAIGTIVGRLIYFGFVMNFLFRKKHLVPDFKLLKPFPKDVAKKILFAGLPATGENITYTVAQLVILSFIGLIGTYAVIAKSYFDTIAVVTYMFANGLAGATAIYVGQDVGAGDYDQAKKTVAHSLFLSVITTVIPSFILIFTVTLIARFFTDDPQIIQTMGTIAIVDIFLEAGRAVSLIVGRSLKASGDAKFTLFTGIIVQWTFVVPLAYVLCFVVGWGMVGIWIAIAADECIRSFIMFLRWKSGRWQSKTIVKANIDTGSVL